MKNYFLIFAIITITTSCNFVSDQEGCAEFYIKNDLSSAVILKTLQHVDSTVTFTLDTFIIAPKETRMMHKYCSLSDIDPYPTGDFAMFTFANNKFKTDTLRNTSFTDPADSVSLYNKNSWITDYSNSRLRIATYTISVKDSTEAN